MVQVVVCGFGTVGRKVVSELRKAGVDYCVIDRKPDVFKDEVFKYIVGDSMKKKVLKAAGASSAEVLIACTNTDETNIFTILVAKGLNPKLRIYAIGKKAESIKKLYMAGAESVVSSSSAGGRAIAKHAIIPHVAEFVDRITLTKDVHITDLVISPKSRLVNVQLKNSRIRENTGVSILAIKRGDELFTNPPSTTVLHANEILIVMGNREQIKLLSRITKG
ncbi:MAG: NAD-binding protein [Thermoplasmata archaeon]|nr:MAG: NAD-binding protein [Thermoplasmata archaeon]